MAGKITRTPEARFWEKVDRRGPDECWPWIGGKTPKGYGMFWLDGRIITAHRAAHKLFIGPVADELVVDHVASRGCTRRDCVNPGHLEAITDRENLDRGRPGAPALNAAKTHCKHGHPLSGDNLYAIPGRRACVTCARERARETQRRIRATRSVV